MPMFIRILEIQDGSCDPSFRGRCGTGSSELMNEGEVEWHLCHANTKHTIEAAYNDQALHSVFWLTPLERAD